jgi:adenylosuccinate lyase
MPFMATERWLMLGVQAGGDRQALHEVVRGHSMVVAEAVAGGAPNDLIERLADDPAFAAVDRARLMAELEPARYVGRSPEQVGEFLAEYLDPLIARARPHAATAEAADLRV